jgi:amino acid adenylation domain-containing protein
LRTKVEGEASFREVLRRVKEVALGGYANQEVPYERVVEEVSPDRELSHSPIFQVMFVMQNAPKSAWNLPGLTLSPIRVESGTSKFDLDMLTADTSQGLVGTLEYSTDLFEAATITRMIENFKVLLEGIVEDAGRRVGELPLLSATQRHRLLFDFNDTHADFLTGRPAHQLISDRAALCPHSTAVSCGPASISYSQLERRSGRLARVLAQAGVTAETPVGVFLERGIDMVVAMLGVMKAGGVYVPIDPAYPRQRLDYIIRDSGLRVVVSQSGLERELAGGVAEVVCVDGDEMDADEVEADDGSELREVYGEQLAYVIYTSGSTGEPKGAMVTHEGMANHLWVKVNDLGLREEDKVGQTASQCFDISVWQALAALMVGGEVVVVKEEEAREPGRLMREVERAGVTVLEVVPTMLRAMLEEAGSGGLGESEFSKLRWMIATGEELDAESSRRWMMRYTGVGLMNAYGPTECSDDVTHHVVREGLEAGSRKVAIGKAVGNVRLYIVDERMEAVAEGVAGELLVGGVAVGRGYHKDACRTAISYVPDALSGEAGARLYRTGDVCRYVRGGEVEFVGRADGQVKVRGYRVEVGEVEAAMMKEEGVKEAVVVARGEGVGGKRLVGYVVMEKGEVVRWGEMRRRLKERLPEYMVPSSCVRVERMPLSANGKIDRRALPDPQYLDTDAERLYVAPRTAMEEALVEIWREVLKIDRVGVYDNFFELGGHSLRATQVISRIRNFFQLDLPLRTLFESPTVADLTVAIVQFMFAQDDEANVDRILDGLRDIPEQGNDTRLGKNEIET